MKTNTFIAKATLFCCLLAVLSGTVFAQPILTDLGATGTAPNTPVPGPLDITNITAGVDVQFPDSLNYYDNNNYGLTPGGQTFHVPNPMVLTSVALQMGGDFGPNSYGMSGGPAPFFLRIFQVDGTSATLITTYESQTNATFASNHWIQWTNITCPLISASGNFAYTFGCDPDPSWLDANGNPAYNGWAQLWAVGGNTYPNGEICTIDNAGGANAVHFGMAYTGLYDANFCLGLANLACPVLTPIVISPTNIIFLGSPVTLIATAGGQSPLSYQWQTDGGGGGALTNIPGAITNFYTFTAPATGTYHFTTAAANTCGSATSTVATLTVLPASPPLLTTDIGIYNTNVYGFVGGNVSFYANFGLGTLPITNKWLVKLDSGGGYTPVSGDPNSAWTCTNVQLSSSGYYELAATNAVGRSNSTAAHLTVLADPPTPDVSVTNVVSGVTNIVTSYCYYVVTNKPWAYWRFEETTNSFTNSIQAYDYSGHNFDATYLSASTNITGGTGCYDGGEAWNNGFGGPGSLKSADLYSGIPTNNMCAQMNYNVPNGYLTTPPLNLNTNAVTFTMWIRPNSDVISQSSGLLMWHNGGDVAGVGFGQNLDVNQEASRFMPELGYTWNTNSPSTYYFHSQLYPIGGIWSFAAWVITPTNATIYLYYVNAGKTNVTKAVNTMAHTPESFSGGLTCLGSDNGNTARTFDGDIDEVAVFTNSLSETQIQAMFLRAIGISSIGVPPYITTINNQPNVPNPPPGTNNEVAVWQGQPLRISANGGGIPAPTWQWEGGNNTVAGNWNSGIVLGGDIADTKIGPSKGVSGSTTSSLVFTNYNSPFEWLAVRAGNSAGATTSCWVRINFIPIAGNTNAQWTVNFNVGDIDTVYHGRGVLGTGTNWNALSGINSINGPRFTNTPPSLLDDGTTVSGINFGSANIYIGGSGAGGMHNALLDNYCYFVDFGAYFVFTGVPNGIYNLALYGINGQYANEGTVFSVQGVTQSVTNQQDINFAPDNTVIYRNLLVTNGILGVAMAPVRTPNQTCPMWGCPGAFNGAQLQLVNYGPVWTAPFTNNTMTWMYGGLYEATNIMGPWTTNTHASPYTFNPTGSMKFYRIYNPNF